MRGYLSVQGLGLFPGHFLGWSGGCTAEVIHFRSPHFPPEVLTDPTYHRKIVIADSDTIDDKWPSPDDIQSFMPHLAGLVVLGRIRCDENENSHFTLVNFLNTNKISGFIPDRSDLLRDAIKFSGQAVASLDRIRERAEGNIHIFVPSSNTDLRAISSPQEFLWDLTPGELPEERHSLVVWDFGVNYSLLRNLRLLGCKLRVAPPDTSPERIIALHPDGIIIAGGPLESSNMEQFLHSMERIVGIRPAMGVGNGALIMARALGIALTRLESPHYGAAIPVEDHAGRVISTYQSHALTVDRASLLKAGGEISYLNLNDGSIEGFVIRDYAIMAALFAITPENSPRFISEFIASLDKT